MIRRVSWDQVTHGGGELCISIGACRGGRARLGGRVGRGGGGGGGATRGWGRESGGGVAAAGGGVGAEAGGRGGAEAAGLQHRSCNPPSPLPPLAASVSKCNHSSLKAAQPPLQLLQHTQNKIHLPSKLFLSSSSSKNHLKKLEPSQSGSQSHTIYAEISCIRGSQSYRLFTVHWGLNWTLWTLDWIRLLDWTGYLETANIWRLQIWRLSQRQNIFLLHLLLLQCVRKYATATKSHHHQMKHDSDDGT